MEEKQFSRTATIMAYHRAYHSMYDTPKIFDDFLAYHLVAEEARAIIGYHMARALKLYEPELAKACPDQATAIARMMRALAAPSMTLSRSRYTEDSLEEAVGQGVKQYVILGAGLDTFAFRRPEMLERLQVFEVDHPATQAVKCHHLAGLGWEQPAQLHFIPVDFEHESLAALTRSSYDPQVLSLFSLLGVTYYLTCDAVLATLGAITGIVPSGSIVIFDYLDTDSLVPGRAAKRVQMMIEDTRQLADEPMITGFDPSSLATELASIGLRVHEDLNPSDIEERYFQGRTDGYHACEHQHFAWAVVA